MIILEIVSEYLLFMVWFKCLLHIRQLWGTNRKCFNFSWRKGTEVTHCFDVPGSYKLPEATGPKNMERKPKQFQRLYYGTHSYPFLLLTLKKWENKWSTMVAIVTNEEWIILDFIISVKQFWHSPMKKVQHDWNGPKALPHVGGDLW